MQKRKNTINVLSWKMLKIGGLPGLILVFRSLLQFLFSRGRAWSEHASVDSSAMIFILYAFVAFGVAAYYLFFRKQPFGNKVLFHSPIRWFIYYTILGFISFLWSVDPMLTWFRAFECLSMLLLIVATIMELYRRAQNTDIVIQWSLLYTFVSIFFSFLTRAKWDHGMGLFEASQMVATTFFYLAIFQSRSKIIRWTIILFSFFSGSTTAYIGMTLGLSGLLFTKMKYRVVVFLVAVAAGVGISIIGVDTVLKNTVFVDRQEAVGGDLETVLENSSGRNHVWEAALKSTAEQPWGYGFFAGEPYILYAKKLAGINAHNSFMSALMGVGPIGAIMLLIFFLSFGPILLSKYIPDNYRPALIGCFCVGILHSMANPGIGSRVYGSWLPVTYLLVLIVCVYIYHRYSSPRHQ